MHVKIMFCVHMYIHTYRHIYALRPCEPCWNSMPISSSIHWSWNKISPSKVDLKGGGLSSTSVYRQWDSTHHQPSCFSVQLDWRRVLKELNMMPLFLPNKCYLIPQGIPRASVAGEKARSKDSIACIISYVPCVQRQLCFCTSCLHSAVKVVGFLHLPPALLSNKSERGTH